MTEKSLDVGDVPAYEEWMDIPTEWTLLGKKNVTTKKGNPANVLVWRDKNGYEISVFDWALRREHGKSFQILKRIYAQLQQSRG